jgi:hypothetical protein
MLPKVHAELSPGIEMALGGDGAAAGPLVLAVADVLGEGCRADDGWLVGLGVLPDVVGGAVASDGAHLLALRGTGTVGGVLLDVVLYEGVLGPAIDRDKDGTGSGGGGAGEVDLPVSGISNAIFCYCGEIEEGKEGKCTCWFRCSIPCQRQSHQRWRTGLSSRCWWAGS